MALQFKGKTQCQILIPQRTHAILSVCVSAHGFKIMPDFYPIRTFSNFDDIIGASSNIPECLGFYKLLKFENVVCSSVYILIFYPLFLRTLVQDLHFLIILPSVEELSLEVCLKCTDAHMYIYVIGIESGGKIWLAIESCPRFVSRFYLIAFHTFL